MAGQTVTVSVLADTKPMARAFSGLSSKLGLDKISGAARQLGKAVAAGAVAGGAGLGALAVAGVRAASDLQQSVGGVSAVFKDNAGQVGRYAKAAAGNVGLTKNAYNGLATIIGTQLKASGVPMDELAGKTNKLITRSADLAATFGGPVTQASEAMAAALRGEFEPLRRYGVSLSVADIEARALADTNKKSTTELTKQEKALATQALIMEQSADAAGQFARENDTLAGKLERAKATAGNLAAALGTVLLPAATAALGWLMTNGVPAIEQLGTWAQDHLLPALQQLGAWFAAEGLPRLQQFGAFITGTVLPALVTFAAWVQANVLPRLVALGAFITGTVVPALAQLGSWVQQNSAWLGPLVAALAGAAVAFRAVQIALAAKVAIMATWKAAQVAAAAAQATLNAVMLANPIGLVIIAITALVAAFAYLWVTNEGFRNAMKAAWSAIVNAVKSAWSYLSGLPARFSAMMTTIRTTVQVAIARVILFFAGLPDKARSAAASLQIKMTTLVTDTMTRMKDRVSNGVDRVRQFFADLPGRARSAAASLTVKMGTLAGDTMTRMKDRVTRGIDNVLGFFRRMPGRITGALGNLGSTLSSAGHQLIDGFLRAIRARFDSVKRELGRLTNLIPSWKGPADKDRRLLQGNGQLIIGGLIRGLDPRRVRKHLGKLTKTIGGTQLPALSAELPAGLATPAGSPRLATGGNRYEITVQALEPTPEVGRLVVKAIRDYETTNGALR